MILQILMLQQNCFLMNDAFDILNCRSKYSKNPYCLALDEKQFEKYEHFSKKFYNYVIGLRLPNGKRVTESGRKTGFVGLIKTLHNVLKLYTNLQKKYYLAYLLSFKLQRHFVKQIVKDYVETFFSSVRQRDGFNNNPSRKQFKSAYKKLLVHNEIGGSQYGNCVSILDNTQMSVVNVGPDCMINNDIEEDLNTVEQDHVYIQSLSRLTPFLDEVTSYTAGFVVKKIK